VTQETHSIVSVALIVVNWGGREVTLECLRSLQKVRYDGLHLIVVDNASEDGSVEAIRKEFPGLDILVQAENLRFAGGNNVGIRRALALKSDSVLLLNNDTVVDPGMVDALVGRMNSDSNCGMVAPKIFYYNHPDVLWFAGGEISLWTGTMKHTGIREDDRGQHDRPSPIDYATGCCMLIRSSIIPTVGLLDESYFIYGEDADWCMRIRSAGYSIWYEPSAKVWHKLSVSAGGHLSLFKLQNKFISSVRFFSRHAKWYHWLTWPWLSILTNVVAAIRYKIQVAARTPPV